MQHTQMKPTQCLFNTCNVLPFTPVACIRPNTRLYLLITNFKPSQCDRLRGYLQELLFR